MSVRRIRLLILSLAFAVSGCKTPSHLSATTDLKSAKSAHATYLEGALLKDLRAANQGSMGKAWFQSTVHLAPDWLIDSPAGYWGRDPVTLPTNLGCNGSSPGCDPQFSRHLCTKDEDCAPYRTTCKVLSASVHKPGDAPSKMCLGSGDELMNRFYTVMVSAEQHLDITTLSNPTWRFWTMMVNAITYLSLKHPAPTIRILMSGRNSTELNSLNPVQPVLDEITSEVKRLGGNSDALHIDVGYLASGWVSWNHAKIVLADTDRAIVGGHNMWDPDYLEDHAVFDASMEYAGAAAAGTQAFVNELWSHVADKVLANYPVATTMNFLGGTKPLRITPPTLTPTTPSTVHVIGVGRLGAYGDNPSDTVQHSLFRNAKDSVYLAQEDVFSRMYMCDLNVIQDRLNLGNPQILGDMVDAILRGVKVRIVQSDQIGEGISGYAMMSPKDAASFITEALVNEAQRRHIAPPAGQTLAQYMCSQFEIAPWRFTAGKPAWDSGSRKIGSHPKIIIADEAVFYLGSHNIYPGNLQEFGLVTTDAAVTQDLVDNYWSKVWSAASQDKIGRAHV